MREILGLILLGICIFSTSIYNLIEKQDGFSQSTIIILVQTISYILCIIGQAFIKNFKSKVNLDIKVLNDFYNTDFSVIYLNKQKKVTEDFERKIRIEFKINYTKKLFPLVIFNKIIDGVVISFEIERDDVTLQSVDRYVISTQHGINIPLKKILASHIGKTTETEFPLEVYAYIILTSDSIYENNEEIIIYPQILNKDGKKIFFRRFFIKSLIKSYKFKLKLEKTI